MPAQTADRPTATNGADLFKTLPSQAEASVRPAAIAPEAASNLRAAQAVETVAALVDAQTGRSQGVTSSVRINFNFNGDDLAVRIEVINGAVHTQFRTDSPELRAAIATQWQIAAPTNPGGALTFLQPAFSAASRSPDTATTQDGGASRREASRDPEANARGWTPARTSPSASTAPAATGPFPHPAAPGRLHAFA
jgi:hypothetical protein